MKTLLRNGLFVSEHGIVRSDFLLERNKIAATGDLGTVTDAHIIDLADAYVLPGLIDMHVHIDDWIGGFKLADDFRTGSRIAIENGITTLWSFITESQNNTLISTIDEAMNRATGNSFCDYGWHLTPTRFTSDDWKTIEQLIERGFRSFKFYTTYRQAGIYSSYDQLADIFGKLKKHECLVLVHCEDDSIIQKERTKVLDFNKPIAHALLRPQIAEVTAIERVINIAKATESALHIVHVSTVAGFEIISRARTSQDISCETCPQYFTFDESWFEQTDGHRWLCSPPFRDRNTVRQISRIASEDGFDIIATDHCPFNRGNKDCHRDILDKIPKGIPGLGALFHQVIQLGETDELGLQLVLNHLAANPAKRLGIYPRKGALLPGSDADIVVVKKSDHEKPVRSTYSDVYDPWTTMNTNWEIKSVWLNGVEKVRNGSLIPEASPEGEWVCQAH